MGGARRERGGGGVTVCAPRAGDAGGGGVRLGRHLGPKRGGARGRAGPRRRRSTVRGGRGEGEAGRAEGGGAAGPRQETGPREEGGAFLFIFPYFPLSIPSNPLLSANFIESSKYSQWKLMCGSA
jgi:hypothetical protein